jgi:transcriptional repressor NF-X1
MHKRDRGCLLSFRQAALMRISSLHETMPLGWGLRGALSAGLPEAEATLVSLAVRSIFRITAQASHVHSKHPCSITCHAPSACPEDEPCSATVDQTCPCGHVRQRTACGACTGNPVSREAVQLKCVSECAQRQRNARLAEALGIKPSEKLVEYPAELRSFATANHAFVLTFEKAFNDFFMGPKQATLLPHTPAHKRQFILSLAEVYRFGTELVDADPYRSVQLRRRIDSRIPNPLLSAAGGAPPAAKRQLGGLGDMKKPSFASLAGPSSVIAPNPVRGWGSASLSSSLQVHPSRMTSTPSLARPLSRPEPPVSTGSGIHKLDHITGSYTPPQKRDIEENVKDWDEEDEA